MSAPQAQSHLYIIPKTKRYTICEPGRDTMNEPEAKTVIPQELRSQIIALRDQVNDLHTLNSYFYAAIESLFNAEETLDKESMHGLWLTMRWLRQQSEQTKMAADDLHRTVEKEREI